MPRCSIASCRRSLASSKSSFSMLSRVKPLLSVVSSQTQQRFSAQRENAFVIPQNMVDVNLIYKLDLKLKLRFTYDKFTRQVQSIYTFYLHVVLWKRWFSDPIHFLFSELRNFQIVLISSMEVSHVRTSPNSTRISIRSEGPWWSKMRTAYCLYLQAFASICCIIVSYHTCIHSQSVSQKFQLKLD